MKDNPMQVASGLVLERDDAVRRHGEYEDSERHATAVVTAYLQAIWCTSGDCKRDKEHKPWCPSWHADLLLAELEAVDGH